MKRIGILGGGQLGRMMALSARQMGYSLITLDPTENAPCAQVADQQIQAPFTDVEAAKRLAAESDVVTYEFENISHEVAEAIGSKLIHGTELLFRTQHRIREKELIEQLGYQVAPYQAVQTTEDLAGSQTAVRSPVRLENSPLWLRRERPDGHSDRAGFTNSDQDRLKQPNMLLKNGYRLTRRFPSSSREASGKRKSSRSVKISIKTTFCICQSFPPAFRIDLEQQAIELATRLANDVI